MEVYELPKKELEITVITMLSVLRKHILARLKGGKCKNMEIFHEQHSLMGKVGGEMPGGCEGDC